MDRKYTPARQVLNLAYDALQRGDKKEARYWAQIAAWMTPDKEDPWLILAAVAKPKAAVAYLKRALTINPNNARAQADLNQAIRQLKQQKNVSRRKNPAQKEVPALLVSVAALELVLAGMIALLLIAFSAIRPRTEPSALSAGHSNRAAALVNPAPPWWQGLLKQATETPLPTATLTPTATATPTASPTTTFTSSPTATPSPSPLPTSTLTATATQPPTATAQPQSNPPTVEYSASQIPQSSGQLIVVSIDQQHLYAFQGGTLVYSFVVSTGVDNSTRMGTFHILDKLPDPYSDPWGFWMPDWMGIYYVGDLEDGFHALPVLEDGERLWGDDLGTPASYGCVVLGIDDAQTLYNWAQIGTTIEIGP